MHLALLKLDLAHHMAHFQRHIVQTCSPYQHHDQPLRLSALEMYSDVSAAISAGSSILATTVTIAATGPQSTHHVT